MLPRLFMPLLVLGLCAVVHAEQRPTRAWDFDLESAGTYKVQVEHDIQKIPTTPAKVMYTITIGHQTQSRELDLIANRPFIPLITDLPYPDKMRVVITGLNPSALQRTRVQVLNSDATNSTQHAVTAKNINREEVQLVNAILQQPADKIDLGRAKLFVDRQIDPTTVDVDGTLAKLEAMASRIRLMPEYGTTGDAKVSALRRYLYEPNAANDYQAFEYDLADPMGSKIQNKLLSNYLSSKKGNCVTMPMLFVILGQRLGIDLTLAAAPRHLLVKFKSEEYGRWINLEATSGANPARDVWLRQQFPSMTDQAIANGLYLRALTRKEAAAEMVETLAEYHYQQGHYDKAISVANVVLEFNPKNAGAMTLTGSAYSRLVRQRFMDRYPSSDQIPANEQSYFQYLARNNVAWFNKAEALGWREESKEEKDEYLQHVDQARQRSSSTN